MKYYKVWVEIEEIDEDNYSYQDVSPFPVSLGEFSTIEEADAAIVELTGHSSLSASFNKKMYSFKVWKHYYVNATVCLTVTIPDSASISESLEQVKYNFSAGPECDISTDGILELEYLNHE